MNTKPSCSPWAICFLMLVLAALTMACMALSSGSQGKPTAVESANQLATSTLPPAESLVPTAAETQPALPVQKATKSAVATKKPVAKLPTKQAAPTEPTNLFKDFPIYQDATVDPGGTSSEATSANIMIHVMSSPADVAAFYEEALAKQGWQERMSEANWTGGFKQTWKKGQSYLELEYVFQEDGPVLLGRIEVVEQGQAMRDLPKGFPVPDGADLIQASSTSFVFDVPQAFDKTVSQYQKMASERSWKPSTGGGMEGSCGGDCGEAGSDFKAFGLTPMPTLTPDPRRSKDLRFILPDGTQADLSFMPHQDRTLIYVSITWKDPARAGLPVEAYPGATIQNSDKGMLTFEVKADLKTVIAFYEDALKAGGWTAGVVGVNTPEMYTQNWTKDNQDLTIGLTTVGGTVTGIIACTNCAGN